MNVNISGCLRPFSCGPNPSKIKSWVSLSCAVVTEWLVLLPAPWNMELWLLKLFQIKCNSLCTFRYQKLLTGRGEVKKPWSTVLSCFAQMRWGGFLSRQQGQWFPLLAVMMCFCHPTLPCREGAQSRLLPSPESAELWLLGQGDLPQGMEPSLESSLGKCSDLCRQSSPAQRVGGSASVSLSGRTRRV